ncbi:putative cytochrome c oxidase subunit 5b-like [Typha angustifolia]|uniref:putative cytochrome c oxidase subunit 5b-like n=1 Tax=Typha angustifolia TaxID=59011 RepID=UPI003C2B13E7
MWRRISSHSQAVSLLRSHLGREPLHCGRALLSSAAFRPTSPLLSSESGDVPAKKKVEDVMPIATGHEREEIEAELEGKKRFDMDAPVGPFGTKEAPAIIESYYNKRIVGCPGGEGEDEHDVVWFWLEKDKPHECPVCSQYFALKVIGEGGDPDGHGDDDHH